MECFRLFKKQTSLFVIPAFSHFLYNPLLVEHLIVSNHTSKVLWEPTPPQRSHVTFTFSHAHCRRSQSCGFIEEARALSAST